MNIFLFVSITVIIIILLFLAWRFASEKLLLPCPSWLGWLVELDNPFTRINRSGTIINQLQLTPHMTVLDVGCGPGRLTIPIAKKLNPYGVITALDVQQGMLDAVRKKAILSNLNNIEYVESSIKESKLRDNYYDRALLVTVLGEIPNKKEALEKIFKALKPNGRLLITEVIFDPHFQTQKKVQSLAEQAKFKWQETHGKNLTYTIIFSKEF